MTYYPLVGFHFLVEFIKASDNSLLSETSFQEVGGLTAEISIEELQEGGVNDYSHRMPGRTKFGNLVLKRGMLKESSELITWALNAIENRTFEPMNIYVSLLNENMDAVITWEFMRSWPVKLVTSDLKAQDSGIAIESMELAYSYMRRKFNSTT